MTQEIKDKLEQAASRISTKAYPEAHAGFMVGAQTILENPKEWGLCQKYDVAKERTKWVKAYSHNDKEKNSSLMHQVNEIEELQSQLTKYREAFDRIIDKYYSQVSEIGQPKWIAKDLVEIAKEALKQQ